MLLDVRGRRTCLLGTVQNIYSLGRKTSQGFASAPGIAIAHGSLAKETLQTLESTKERREWGSSCRRLMMGHNLGCLCQIEVWGVFRGIVFLCGSFPARTAGIRGRAKGNNSEPRIGTQVLSSSFPFALLLMRVRVG